MVILTRIFISALALLLVAKLVPGVQVDSFYIALIAAFIIGVLNVLVRPVLVLLTLPITIVTLGLFIFVINASLFWFAASFIDGFDVSSFLDALAGSLIVSIISTIGNKLVAPK